MLAQGFGRETIAEGVETRATLELLAEYGVNYASALRDRPSRTLQEVQRRMGHVSLTANSEHRRGARRGKIRSFEPAATTFLRLATLG
jgi:hypothetical protein